MLATMRKAFRQKVCCLPFSPWVWGIPSIRSITSSPMPDSCKLSISKRAVLQLSACYRRRAPTNEIKPATSLLGYCHLLSFWCAVIPDFHTNKEKTQEWLSHEQDVCPSPDNHTYAWNRMDCMGIGSGPAMRSSCLKVRSSTTCLGRQWSSWRAFLSFDPGTKSWLKSKHPAHLIQKSQRHTTPWSLSKCCFGPDCLLNVSPVC